MQSARRYARLLRARAASPAFCPYGAQQVLDGGQALFALLRTAPDGDARVLCLQNVSSQPCAPALDLKAIFGLAGHGGSLHDIITGHRLPLDPANPLSLSPYQTLWLTHRV